MMEYGGAWLNDWEGPGSVVWTRWSPGLGTKSRAQVGSGVPQLGQGIGRGLAVTDSGRPEFRGVACALF